MEEIFRKKFKRDLAEKDVVGFETSVEDPFRDGKPIDKEM